MAIVQYNETDDPTERGVYACRIPKENLPGLFEDKFLIWHEGQWGYLGSDQKYRGVVAGWVGPLQRSMSSTSN